MSTTQYHFEVLEDDEVEMVESTSSPKAVTTLEDIDIIENPQERNYPSALIPKPQNSNCNEKCNKNNHNQTIDDDDCTIIDSNDHIDLSVKTKSKIRKRKFPKSLKAKLMEHINCNGETRTKLNKNVSDVRESSHIRNENEDTIVIEDDSGKNNDSDIIECITVEPENQTENKHPHCDNVDNFDEILSKDKVLADLIETCLDMENSTGMLRIINRTVIPIYRDTSEDFKSAHSFQKMLTKTITKVNTEPNKKFSHLKEFCEFMKSGIHKKRVQLTTLKTNLNGKFSKTKKKPQSSLSTDRITRNKKKKIEVINLDDDEEILPNGDDVERQVINNNIEVNSSVNDDTEAGNNAISKILVKNILSKNYACYPKNDENTSTNDTEISKQNEMHIIIQDVRSEAAEVSSSSDNNNHIQNTDVNKEEEIKANEVIQNHVQDSNKTQNEIDVICLDDENDILKENMFVNVSSHVSQTQLVQMPLTEYNVKTQIETIEAKIKSLNDMIRNYEEKELDWDKDNHEESPYVVCENYKELLVKLYKRLCELTGNEAVKRRQVRLKVAEGRHEGPVRFLEEFLNSRIDENGNPPFPDIHDVTNCVTAANLYHSIGWSKREIDMEARALFIHFGRTIQKKRQKREWRHLMRYVKEQVVDPADADPALQARLEENARLALKNEADLFDRYAEMDGLRTTIDHDYATLLAETSGPSNVQHNNHNMPIPRLPPTPINNSILEINSYKDSCNGNITDNIEMNNASSNRCTVMLPNVVAIPLNLSVNQSLVPIMYYTNTVGDPVLDNMLPINTNEDTTRNRENVERDINANNEREMVEIEIDMRPNLNQLNGSHSNTLEGAVIPIEFESQNSVNRNVRVENINTAPNSNLTNCDNAQKNYVNLQQQINCNQNETNVAACETATLQVNQVSPNATKSSAENNDFSSFSEVFTHTTHEKENTNMNEEIPENIVVKEEPLDVPKMLAALGEDFTVSIMDIEDPFEVIEISDSSDSEEEYL